MKVLKVAALLGLGFLSASMAFADGVDPRASPGRGPTGSPPFGASQNIPVADSGIVVDDYTVVNGLVTAISITFPAVDVALGVTCGASNAFLDGGKYNAQIGGFAPVMNADGTATCNWGPPYPTPPNYRTPGGNIPELEALCLATNTGGPNNPQDCEGVPAGTAFSDVVFTIEGAVPDVDLGSTGTIVTTPEPASLALLVLGLGSLALFYRRRLA
jgi:PEP-CTERM motif